MSGIVLLYISIDEFCFLIFSFGFTSNAVEIDMKVNMFIEKSGFLSFVTGATLLENERNIIRPLIKKREISMIIHLLLVFTFILVRVKITLIVISEEIRLMFFLDDTIVIIMFIIRK